MFPSDQQEQVRTQLAGSLEAIVAQVLLKRADGKGRVAAHEICVATQGVKALIRENKIFQIQSALQTGAKVGMQTLSAVDREAVRRRQDHARRGRGGPASALRGRRPARQRPVRRRARLRGIPRRTMTPVG